MGSRVVIWIASLALSGSALAQTPADSADEPAPAKPRPARPTAIAPT